jgi:predicted metalloprotease with PDZ domain
LLIAFELDAALLVAGSCLDDALRDLYTAHLKTGYTHQHWVECLVQRAPTTREVVMRTAERAGGLRLQDAFSALGFAADSETVQYIGLTLSDNKGPLVVQVLDGSPASDCGVAPGDELVRVGGFSFSLTALQWQVTHRDRIELEVRRGHQWFTFELVPSRRSQVGSLVFNGSAERLRCVQAWIQRKDFQPTSGQSLPLTWHDNFHGVFNLF